MMQMNNKSPESRLYCKGVPTDRMGRVSPFAVVGSLLSLLLIVGAGALLLLRPALSSHAQSVAAVNGDCSLIVPSQPLTAQGLATPYQLVATDRDKGACHENNLKQAAFVQGAIFDPQTNQISIYNPLVVDRGDKPAVAPVVPKLPSGAVVGLWFGFNGDNLTLRGDKQNLQTSNCVNGLADSIFGQFAYCNASAFFNAANQAITSGKLTVPDLGTASDGMTCPTVRDFSLIDMDQSDNVTTQYIIDPATGHMAQHTDAVASQLPQGTLLSNGSDNGLLSLGLDSALNCRSWVAPDLANPGHTVPALPLNELQAAAHQAAPVALVPSGDPMVKVGDNSSLAKVNLYRAGVDQPLAQSLANANTAQYCLSFLDNAPSRIFADKAMTIQKPSADPLLANNLFTFLAQRFNGSWGPGGLNCQGLLGLQSPIKLTMQGNITVDATLVGTRPVKGKQDQNQPAKKPDTDKQQSTPTPVATQPATGKQQQSTPTPVATPTATGTPQQQSIPSPVATPTATGTPQQQSIPSPVATPTATGTPQQQGTPTSTATQPVTK
ncbi:hypothetical protein [Dictyobacter aurantiacus]|uniref:Uncharacterized protein n=1 Tax=Dictyobacter aurantiacus TaxID=1936993 RepID=A0A401ZCP6_9CHLR|nr:hypothetical protein [Dictyobacter aurantiacus]GCE04468.1 hypothetical protein KDAU_17970 [Dictyobacter aurantiacus]